MSEELKITSGYCHCHPQTQTAPGATAAPAAATVPAEESWASAPTVAAPETEPDMSEELKIKVRRDKYSNVPGREVRKCSSGKRRFLTKASAEARIKENGGKPQLYVYHCEECGQWHLTRSKPR